MRGTLLAVSLYYLLAAPFQAASAEPAEPAEESTEVWPSWGGPAGDFTAPPRALAESWPEAGPKVLWKRALGDDGYSGIVGDGGRLYTMARRGDDEIVLALDAVSGETLWEFAYPASLPEGAFRDYGDGPHATPALAGGRLFTFGVTAKLHAFDAATGKVVWTHDLQAEFEPPFMVRGHGASPLIYDDLVILTPGGEGHAVTAFRQSDGEIAWRSLDFRQGYSSPIRGRFKDREMVIVAMGPERAGLDPKSGELLWRLTLGPEAASIMSTQLWDGERGILFGSSAYADGSRAIRLTQGEDGKIAAEEIWASRKMRVQHGTAVRVGDHVYGSSGDFGPAFLAATDLETGELAFRQRGFAKANLLAVGDKILLLDENGLLALGTPSPEGIEIHAQAQIFNDRSWTVPTLLGTTLYVRDRKEIQALDLAVEPGS